ncbi:MAG: hypothetical protein K2N23_02060, partial [Clostridia bacterium]|nr:hypothetical protein [Clostridia bacterium]
MQNAENKSKKFVVLATYVVAVLCLLAGLFLPLFNGKNILALKLLDVFKGLLGKADDPNAYGLMHRVSMFGITKLSFDFMALVIVLYAFVTALALLSFIPVALSVRKEGKLAKKFYYGIEIAATIVLSLFFVVLLQDKWVNCYNIVIAICGTVVALLVLRGMDKGKYAAVNFVLFLLSAVGFVALFDIIGMKVSPDKFEKIKLTSAMVGEGSGVDYLTTLFAPELKLSDMLSHLPDAKSKALLMFGALAATVVLVNFFIDTIRLCTGKDKKVGLFFNVVRYALEVILALCVLLTALFSKAAIGLMLIAILAVSVIKLAIVTIKLVMFILRKPDNARVADGNEEEPVENDTTDEVPEATTEEVPADEYGTVDNVEEQPYATDGYDESNDEDIIPSEVKEDDDGYISPEEDALVNQERMAEDAQEATEEVADEEPSEEIDYEIKTDGTYLLPADETVKEEPVEEPIVEEADEPIEEVEKPEEVEAAEDTAEEPEKVEAVEEATDEEADEPIEEVEKPEEVEAVEDTAKEEDAPSHEEIKPYNPYERHNSNNPFRAYEQSSQPIQPYNPYQSQTAKPTQTTRPVNEQKPAPKYKPYEPANERPQNVRPLQPRPIIQEFKPVPPISEQPKKEKQVYTIDKIYAGPIDDFIRKLSN